MVFDAAGVALMMTAAVSGVIAIGTFIRVGATELRAEKREAEKLTRELARDLMLQDMKQKVDGLGDIRAEAGLRAGTAEGKAIGVSEERARASQTPVNPLQQQQVPVPTPTPVPVVVIPGEAIPVVVKKDK